MRTLMLLVGLAALAHARWPEQAPTPTGTAVVTGVVVDSMSGAPVAGAVVSVGSPLRPDHAKQARQVTDRRGRFAFTDVPAPADLVVMASKPGFIATDPAPAFGRSPFNRLTVADGDWIGNVRIEMSRLGSISGEVIDEAGQPVAGVAVRVLAEIRVAGHPRLATGPSDRTDDRGRYRVGGLLPGRYIVAVPSVQASVPVGTAISGGQPRMSDGQAVGAMVAGSALRVLFNVYPVPPPPSANGQLLAYPTMFHPGATTVGAAARVTLGVGEQRQGVHVHIAPFPVSDVAGRIDAPAGVVSGLTTRLLADGLEDLGLGMETATALVGPDGSFRFTGVPAASYVIDVPGAIAELQFSRLSGFLVAPAAPPGVSVSGSYVDTVTTGPPGTIWLESRMGGDRAAGGRTRVVVGGGDVDGIVLRLSPSARVAGRVLFEFDTRTPSASTPNVQLRLEPADGDPALGMPRTSTSAGDPRRSFEFGQVAAGRYFVRVMPGLNFQVKHVSVAGRDHTDVPIDAAGGSSIDDVVVTLTNVPTRVQGSVRDERGAPAAYVRIVAFPVERSWWADHGLSSPRLASAVSDNAGGFAIDGLPEGDYYLVALPHAPHSDWRNTDLFERAAGVAERIEVRWGRTARQDLRFTETIR